MLIDCRKEAEKREERLLKGSDVLFEMEQAGDTDADYERWLGRFVEMLEEYDACTRFMLLTGFSQVEV